MMLVGGRCWKHLEDTKTWYHLISELEALPKEVTGQDV